MKTLIYVLGILIAMLFTNQTSGADSDSSKVVKKIIKTIEINDDEMEYNITVDTDGDTSKVIVMKCPDGIKREILMSDKDFVKPEVFMFNDEDFSSFQRAHKTKKIRKNNFIDLNDPSIISFEKEETKNGNEKITIIRKKQK